MSKTIIVSEENVEHVLTVEPNDKLPRILNNMLGNTLHCTFHINGTMVSIETLQKEIRNNTRVEVIRCSRGAPISLGLQGFPFVLESQKNPARPKINIESVHISCSSDPYDPNEDMAGLIIYSFDDQQDFRLNGHHCRTGYILIKTTKNIANTKSNQGIVHGNLFKWFFGIEPDNRFVGAGFSLHEGKTKFNSGVFNARNDDYHDGLKVMSTNECALIKKTLDELYISGKWRQKSTLSIKEFSFNRYYPGDNLPVQNHPQSAMN